MSEERHNQHFLLAARPEGPVRPEDVEIIDAPMPVPGAREVLVEVQYLAVSATTVLQ